MLALGGLVCGVAVCASAPNGPLDLSKAVVVARPANEAAPVERTAATVLAEEVAQRTGLKWAVQSEWPRSGWSVAVLSGKEPGLLGRAVPADASSGKAEGYVLRTDLSDLQRPVLWIVGSEPRGALYGVGRLLRLLECRKGSAQLSGPVQIASAPAYPIRGHQLGFRATANSYDAWSPDQFDQYIRELTFFGANSIEGIPLQDTRKTVNPYPRDKMNVEQSRICARYGLDYWLWSPAAFDLKDRALRDAALADHRKLYEACPTIAAVFVPGGDPGDNPPQLVMPYLEDLARLLQRSHPNARVWLSMQGYSPFEQDQVYRWISEHRPAWLGGLVGGPSSPPLHDLRARLPRPYQVRDYPDITHCVRAQFPVPWWDPAFMFTLGREPVNPRPRFYSRILHDTAVFTDGFITYSDGVHDDVNKAVWSALGWDPKADIGEIVADYARVFLGPDTAEETASGLFALESNWDGPLATNGGVDATLALWQGIEKARPELRGNWRAQMCFLRANYDAYTRKRLLHERALEVAANAALLQAGAVGSERAIETARAILKRAQTEPVRKDLAGRVSALCADLFRSIGLQTSVEKYQAVGPERGAVLDFLDYPLNNRWWLEDEMAKASKLPSEPEKVRRLEELARWEDPGPGGFYDDIGNVAEAAHVVRNEKLAPPLLDMDHMSLPGAMWWVGDNPNARVRQSWITSMDWPEALKYAGLDPDVDYVIRVTGYGDCFLRANGLRLVPTVYGKQLGEIKEFPVPQGLVRDGMLTVTFDPTFEPNLNWRVQSRLCEVWLIRRPAGGGNDAP